MGIIYFLLSFNTLFIPALTSTTCQSLNQNNEFVPEKIMIKGMLDSLNEDLKNLIKVVTEHIKNANDNLTSNLEETHAPEDCAEIFHLGYKNSGIYAIRPDVCGSEINVFCDLTTDGGGWIVIQKRQDGSENFWREWKDYKTGFGNPNREYWLGNDLLSFITTKKPQELRIDFEDHEGKKYYANYKHFSIFPEPFKYALSIGKFSGDAGDSLSDLNEAPFTTKDQDNDTWEKNCAIEYKGAWWYKACHQSNLNGLYVLKGEHSTFADGINWKSLKGYNYSFKSVQLKIRPLSFKPKQK